MNILIVNQSVMDMCASFFTLLVAVVEVDATGMSRDSVYDRLVCHVWLSKLPLWNFLIMSSYNIALTAVERFLAVVYPIWFNNNVRTCSSMPLVILPITHSVKPLQFFCQSMPLSFVIEERQLMFFSKLHRTDNIVLRTLMCVPMVKYEILSLAVKYGLNDAREGLSTIKDAVWSCFVQKGQL